MIALAQIGRVALLQERFTTVLVPLAVARETPRLALPPWIVTRRMAAVPVRVASAGLEPGETEAIALALEPGAAQILLDDRPARALAAALGLRVVGTLGLLVLAKERGLLAAIRPEIDALLAVRFHLAAWVIEDALSLAGEDR